MREAARLENSSPVFCAWSWTFWATGPMMHSQMECAGKKHVRSSRDIGRKLTTGDRVVSGSGI